MEKGKSYITLTDANSTHPLIKKLHELGFSEIELIYAARWSTDWGWTMVGCKTPEKMSGKLEAWLGYNSKKALKKLNSIKQ